MHLSTLCHVLGVFYHPHGKDYKWKLGELYLAVDFVMERQIYAPWFSLTFAFVLNMLSTHKPQQQATITKNCKIPEMSFCFRNPTERKSKSSQRANREVQTVNWEGGWEGAVERGVKSPKKAHKPWIRGKKGAQTVNKRGAKTWSANREFGTFNLENSSVSVHSLHFMVCAPLRSPISSDFDEFSLVLVSVRLSDPTEITPPIARQV